jgi:hypothetical protein
MRAAYAQKTIVAVMADMACPQADKNITRLICTMINVLQAQRKDPSGEIALSGRRPNCRRTTPTHTPNRSA